MKKVQYAIIGFGGIAENRIAKEGFACDKSRFSPLKSAELVGVTDLNPARRQAAEALGLKWYDSAQAVLADPAIQAVFVATNNRTHAQLAMDALNAGKAVIVEKPLAANSVDAAKLVELARAKKLPLSVDHMMVNNVYNQAAKQLIADGALGTVNDGCFHMEFAYGYDPAEAATWRCSCWDEVGGPIGDVASHCFYMAEYLFDAEITGLAAVYLPKLMGITVEDGAYIKFELSDGHRFSAKVAFSELRGGLGGTLSNLGYEIYGDKAVLRSFGTMFQLSGHPGEPLKIRLELDRFDSRESIQAATVTNIYQAVIEHHAEAVAKGSFINAEDGLRNVLLCELAHRSARANGKWMEVKS